MANNAFSLNGTWRLSSVCIPLSGTIFGFAGATEPVWVQARFRNWQDAPVPGCVQELLLANGELPEPFFADNLDHWRWVEDREWWYRRTFTPPASLPRKRVYLQFEKLDTCATVYLNGHKLGFHANYFRPFEVDVTAFLRFDAENVIAVCLQPPHWHSHFRIGDGTAGFTDPHRVHTRKPQFSFGWDIAPRLMTVGIPGDVTLKAVEDITLDTSCVRTLSIDDRGANVELVLAVTNRHAAATTVELSATVAGVAVKETRQLPIGNSELKLPVRLDGIALWHVRGMGQPTLHDCRVTLNCNNICDSRAFKFGVRTIKLIEEPQADGGTSFIFRLNGKDIYIKGLNYTPGDAILTRVDELRTNTLFQLAYDCNVNLLRIWGGGDYESDHFYDLCDAHGILVWQDFMSGCGLYPQDDDFVNEMGREAEFQLTRLRRHPSLALLAGDNENDCFHYVSGSLAFRTCRLVRGVVAEASRRLCPEIPYIPSSPYSPHSDNPMSSTEGDNHLWDHSAPHDAPPYREDNSRFMSEMGRLSLPPLETIRQMIPRAQELPLTSPAWRFHAADTERVGFGERMAILTSCLRAYGHALPDTLEGLVELSQQVQADALVYWARKYYALPVNGGVIFWNLCDCWPQMSDAVVAYPAAPKEAYYALRDVYGEIPTDLSLRHATR